MLSLLMFALSCPTCIVFDCFSLRKIHPTWDLVSRFLYNQRLMCFSLSSHYLSSELTHLFLLLIEMRPSLLKTASALWGRLCRLTRSIQRESTIVVTTDLRSQVSFSTSVDHSNIGIEGPPNCSDQKDCFLKRKFVLRLGINCLMMLGGNVTTDSSETSPSPRPHTC